MVSIFTQHVTAKIPFFIGVFLVYALTYTFKHDRVVVESVSRHHCRVWNHNPWKVNSNERYNKVWTSPSCNLGIRSSSSFNGCHHGPVWCQLLGVVSAPHWRDDCWPDYYHLLWIGLRSNGLLLLEVALQDIVCRTLSWVDGTCLQQHKSRRSPWLRSGLLYFYTVPLPLCDNIHTLNQANTWSF